MAFSAGAGRHVLRLRFLFFPYSVTSGATIAAMLAGPRMLDDRVVTVLKEVDHVFCLDAISNTIGRNPHSEPHRPSGITAASLSAEPTAMTATVAFFHSRGFAVTTEGKSKPAREQGFS
jgi:hypothetical protein